MSKFNELVDNIEDATEEQIDEVRAEIQRARALWHDEHFVPALTVAASQTDGVDIDDIVGDPAFGIIAEMVGVAYQMIGDLLKDQEPGDFVPILDVMQGDGKRALAAFPEMGHEDAHVRRTMREHAMPSFLKSVEAKGAVLAQEAWYVKIDSPPEIKATTHDEALAEVERFMSVPVREDDRRVSCIILIAMSEGLEIQAIFDIDEGHGRKLKPVPTIHIIKAKGKALGLNQAHWYKEETPDFPKEFMHEMKEDA